MTLKELLDEQIKSVGWKDYTAREVAIKLRQSNIETVKWLMEMIEGKRRKLVTQPAKYKGSDANVWREGKNTTIDDILSELTKSIEDHA